MEIDIKVYCIICHEIVNFLSNKYMNTVIHFEIQADDIERAKKFYEKALGWKVSQMMKKEEGGKEPFYPLHLL